MDAAAGDVPAARCVQGMSRGTTHPLRVPAPAGVPESRSAAMDRIRTQSLTHEPRQSGGPTSLPRAARDRVPHPAHGT